MGNKAKTEKDNYATFEIIPMRASRVPLRVDGERTGESGER
jgi:hypothetical protein